MRDTDIPDYIKEVKETLQNHFPMGVIIFCFKEDPKAPNAMLETGACVATIEALDAAIHRLGKAREMMVAQYKEQGIIVPDQVLDIGKSRVNLDNARIEVREQRG